MSQFEILGVDIVSCEDDMTTMHLARRHPNLAVCPPGACTTRNWENHETQHTIHGGAARRLGALLIVPKGPNGERRPADVVGCAVNVARIATDEVEDIGYEKPAKRRGAVARAKARQNNTTPGERSKIARLAAEKRWKR